MSRILVIRVFALFLGVFAIVVVPGCKKKTAAVADTAPPFTVSDKTDGFLFTWIDAKGDFHVEQKTTDVPIAGRDVVRVVDPNREDGTHADRIFIADLRTPGANGDYPVKVATLADFDKVALDRRQGKLPTLADDGGPTTTVPTAVASNQQSGDVGSGSDPVNTAHPTVIIYGASWCGACHEAEAYLRKKNIPFVDKDIEKDAVAAREMQGKLRQAGLPSGSIPVIDVHGKVMVGFNPGAIDEALGTAL